MNKEEKIYKTGCLIGYVAGIAHLTITVLCMNGIVKLFKHIQK